MMPIFLHGSCPKASLMQETLDGLGAAGDVYVDFHAMSYPTSVQFYEWRRVGEALYGAIEAYDGLQREGQVSRELISGISDPG